MDKELLNLIQQIADSFNAGAECVFASALAGDSDRETLAQALNRLLDKAKRGGSR